MTTSKKYTHDNLYFRPYKRQRLRRETSALADEGESDYWENVYPLNHSNLTDIEREIECDSDRYDMELYWEYLDELPFYRQASDEFLREIGVID